MTKKERAKLMVLPGYDPFRESKGYTYDPDSAQFACDFFPDYLTHVKGELGGKPFYLDPWEECVIRNLFGWKDSEGNRRYKKVFIYVPRKNGKTAFTGGIINLIAFCDGEPGFEIYSAASERGQAGLVFEHAAGMVQQNEELDSQCKVYEGAKSIKYANGTYKVISSDAYSKHGFNVHLAVIDELHAHKKGELSRILESGTGSRRSAMIIYTTTADYVRESKCNLELKKAQDVRDGLRSNPKLLPVIYNAEIDDDWTKESTWKKANPGYGGALKKSSLEEEFAEAYGLPSEENEFKRLHLNIQTEQKNRWLPMDEWRNCKPFDPEKLLGESCYAGLDLASTNDICALLLFFPDYKNAIIPFFWIPSANKDKYKDFIAQDLMFVTEGKTTDYRYIRKTINDVCKDYHVLDIAYDPYNATHLATELTDEDGLPMIEYAQSAKNLNEPSKKLEALIIENTLSHNNNAVMNWMVSNAEVKSYPNGNIIPMKSSSESKIDGVAALVNAIGLWINGESEYVSDYETEGVTAI